MVAKTAFTKVFLVTCLFGSESLTTLSITKYSAIKIVMPYIILGSPQSDTKRAPICLVASLSYKNLILNPTIITYNTLLIVK